MSKQSYVSGFCKAAESNGVDPKRLAGFIVEKRAQASSSGGTDIWGSLKNWLNSLDDTQRALVGGGVGALLGGGIGSLLGGRGWGLGGALLGGLGGAGLINGYNWGGESKPSDSGAAGSGSGSAQNGGKQNFTPDQKARLEALGRERARQRMRGN